MLCVVSLPYHPVIISLLQRSLTQQINNTSSVLTRTNLTMDSDKEDPRGGDVRGDPDGVTLSTTSPEEGSPGGRHRKNSEVKSCGFDLIGYNTEPFFLELRREQHRDSQH